MKLKFTLKTVEPVLADGQNSWSSETKLENRGSLNRDLDILFYGI